MSGEFLVDSSIYATAAISMMKGSSKHRETTDEFSALAGSWIWAQRVAQTARQLAQRLIVGVPGHGGVLSAATGTWREEEAMKAAGARRTSSGSSAWFCGREAWLALIYTLWPGKRRIEAGQGRAGYVPAGVVGACYKPTPILLLSYQCLGVLEIRRAVPAAVCSMTRGAGQACSGGKANCAPWATQRAVGLGR